MNTEDIARRAHGIWEMAGRPQGKAVDHWLQAESELAEVECAPSGGDPAVPAPNMLQGKKASRPARPSTR
jgi:hypothetical protein